MADREYLEQYRMDEYSTNHMEQVYTKLGEAEGNTNQRGIHTI